MEFVKEEYEDTDPETCGTKDEGTEQKGLCVLFFIREEQQSLSRSSVTAVRISQQLVIIHSFVYFMDPNFVFVC